MQATRYYSFIDGKTGAGLINADRLNGNFNVFMTVLNGNIEDDNVKTGAKVLVSDRNYTGGAKITGTYEFQTCPTVPDASIPDAKLGANVPLKNAANVFSAQQKFSVGIDGNKAQVVNFNIERVSSLPTWTSADIGRIVFCTGDGKMYGGNNTQWVQLDYVGAYTGGSIRSHSGSGILDDNDSFKFWFKTDGATPVVKLALKGLPFPKRFYTELAYHTHAFTGSPHGHTITDPGHTHSGAFASSTHTHLVDFNTYGNANADHQHAFSANSGNELATHYHEYQQGDGGTAHTTEEVGTHNHYISGPTGWAGKDHTHVVWGNTQGPSGTAGVGSNTTGITANEGTGEGSNDYAGINIGIALSTAQKLYAYHLQVKIDSTDVTSNILTATGWSYIGDGTGAHAFHVTGTGEMTISSWLSFSPGFHTLEVLEPTTGYGCGILVFIETS